MGASDIDSIRQYWDEQVRKHGSDPRASTQDFWIRGLEIAHLVRVLSRLKGEKEILDIGCGNGYSTAKLLRALPSHHFVGGDYSSEMIRVASETRASLEPELRERIRFEEADVLHLEKYRASFDVVITDRCLINLPSRELQWKAIDQIEGALKTNGHFVAIENFLGAHRHLNEQRRRLRLPPIAVRWHNCFFEESEFTDRCSKAFDVPKLSPISSTYYLMTRVLYSKLCQLQGRDPDYEHPIYRISTHLPTVGDFGPVKLAHMRKRR
jgi:SAM-dependent methyltransferase